MSTKPHQPETAAIRERMASTVYREHSMPLFLTSSFTFDDAETMEATFAGQGEGIIYSRYNNPNVDEFIHKVCQLEGAEDGFATATGMAAVFASLAAFLRQGDHVLASRAIFGSTHQILTQILPHWGISCTFVDPTDVDSWTDQLQPTTRMVVLESPANPGLMLVDLAKVGELTRRHNLIFNIDNCFATPYLQKPIEYGADLVVHSATKWMDGQGRILGGIVVGKKELIEPLRFFCRHTGPAMAPFNAWVLSKSLETLSLRMDRHCANALALAQFLEKHPRVGAVRYPFLPSHPQHALAQQQMRQGGGIVTIELPGGLEQSRRFLNNIQMVSLSSNLGDTRTILTHPATTTHSRLSPAEQLAVGITPGTIRISVGLEHLVDIQNDLDQALQKS